MTITDISSEVNEINPGDNVASPYFADYEQLSEQVARIPTEAIPYLTTKELPNLPEGFNVYRISANEPLADPVKAFEATVKSKKWGEPREVTAKEAAPLEHNSFFFVLLDETSETPKIAASLRVADITNGKPSETRAFFERSFPGESLPKELTPEIGEKVWDIVLVVADKEYNNGSYTPWVYHSLYRASLEEGVDKWIANINDHEHGNLEALSIPFHSVSSNAVGVSNAKGKEIFFRFYGIDVREIQESMTARVVRLMSLIKKYSQMDQAEIQLLPVLEQIEAVASPLWLKAAQIAVRGGEFFFDNDGTMNMQDWPPKMSSSASLAA